MNVVQFPKRYGLGRRQHVRASAGSCLGSTMPHSEQGAEQPARRKASCITTKVSAGNLTKPFQLKAAPYLRPVRSATAETPPKASITSAVVDNSRSSAVMDSANNPSFLDTQHPNVIDTKKFGDAACSLPMANAGSDGDDDIALRCRALTRLYAGGNSSKFAAEIGISPTRWNNIERSGALSKDVARQIVRAHPEISLDWLWRGLDDAYSRTRSDEFMAAFRAIQAEARAEQRASEGKRPKRQAG